MRRSLAIGLLVSIAFSTPAVAQQKSRPRKLPSQLQWELESRDGTTFIKAKKELEESGAIIAPAMIEILAESKCAQARGAAAEILAVIAPQDKGVVKALMKALTDIHAGVRGQAAAALYRMKPQARSAAGALLARLREEDDAEVRIWVARAISQVAEPEISTPAILSALKDSNRMHVPFTGALGLPLEYFSGLTQTLGEIGPRAIPMLKLALGDHDRFVRAGAALGLVQVATSYRDSISRVKPAIPAITGLLKDHDPFVRGKAADALGSLGREAAGAVSELIQATTDPEVAVRDRAIDALASIGPPARGASEALLDRLKDRSDMVRLGAIRALEKFPLVPSIAVPVYIKLLDDKDPLVAQAAIKALANFGPESKGAVSRLEKTLRSDDEDQRRLAAYTLGEIGPPAKSAVPALLDMWSGWNWQNRRYASTALKKIDPEAARKAGIP